MHSANRFRASPLELLLLLLTLGLAFPPVSYADPPPHAPAHGWRKKHDPYYVGYSGTKWPRDYGILAGRCDHTAVGAVLGGVVGGAIGSQIGKGDGRTVAIIVGTVLGAAVGAKIAQDMDAADRACIGHTLELAPVGRRVVWHNADTDVDYAVIPTRSYKVDGRDCREFTTERYYDDKRSTGKGRACRGDDGEWRIM